MRFWKAAPAGAYTVRACVRPKDMEKLKAFARRCGCSLAVRSRTGVPFHMRRLKKRGALLSGLALSLCLLFTSSLFIWEIEVTGNREVPDYIILSALEDAGVGIGSFWPPFVSDMIRSRVLVKVPELSFITVNVYGSRAEVITRERVQRPEIVNERIPADIVARKAGIISDMNVYSGAAAVHEGQTVLKGEMLVSGLTPSTLSPPRDQRINFYRNSGIDLSDCDKIMEKDQIAIKGLFTFPIAVVKERYRRYNTGTEYPDVMDTSKTLQERLWAGLKEEIGEGGEIVSHVFSVSQSGGLLTVTLRAECLENIAKTAERNPNGGRTP